MEGVRVLKPLLRDDFPQLPRNGVLVCTSERLNAWMNWMRGDRLLRLNHIRERAAMEPLTLEQAARLMIGSTEKVREEIKASLE